MSVQIDYNDAHDLTDIVRLERLAFAAKIRMARAAIGWSQTELASLAGLTQRSVHKLEQGGTDPRRATVRAIERLWRENDIEFEDLADGGFRVSVGARSLDGPRGTPTRRRAAARPAIGVSH